MIYFILHFPTTCSNKKPKNMCFVRSTSVTKILLYFMLQHLLQITYKPKRKCLPCTKIMVIERRQAEADTAIVPGSTSQTQTKVNYENDMHSISKSIDGVIGGIAAFQAVGLGSNPSQCYTAYLIVSIYLVHSTVYIFILVYC